MRKTIACLLTIAMLLCVITTSASAATTYSIPGKGGTVVKISHTSVNGSTVGGCWEYANQIYNKIWGSRFSNSFSDGDNSLRLLNDEQRRITEENTRLFISHAPLGAVIRIASAPSTDSHFANDDAWYSGDETPCLLDNGKPKRGHSMILVAKTSTGFTYIQAGSGKSSEKTVTWSSFASANAGTYVYFKYIKWPGAGDVLSYTTISETDMVAISIKGKTGKASDDQCYVKKNLPYESATTVRVVDKYQSFDLTATVQNNYGNKWYKTSDGYFVYSNDVAVYTIVESVTGTAVSTKKKTDDVDDDQCYIKRIPYEVGDTVRVVGKGGTITIDAIVKNHHGNTWYRTTDGYFVYSGDVELTTYKSTTLFNCSLFFTNTEKRAMHVAPYLDSPERKTCEKGEVVAVTRFVRNSHGNIWAQLSNGSFICYYDYEVGRVKLEFYGVDYSVSGIKKPTGDIPLNKSYPLAGKITVESPMLLVTAKVTNERTGQIPVGPIDARPSELTRTIDIDASINGVNINDKMAFRNLKTAGWYCYEVIVRLGFTDSATGKTFTFGDKTVVESHFTAGSPVEDEKPLPDVGGTQIGTNTGLRGDVNDDGVVNMIDIMKTAQYVFSDNTITINLKNADVNNDGIINMIDIMQIARIVYPAPSTV